MIGLTPGMIIALIVLCLAVGVLIGRAKRNHDEEVPF